VKYLRLHGRQGIGKLFDQAVAVVEGMFILMLLLQIEWVIFSVFSRFVHGSVAPHYREVVREDAKHSLGIDGMLGPSCLAARAVNPRSPQGYAGGVRG
jgi:hypothetical protein